MNQNFESQHPRNPRGEFTNKNTAELSGVTLQPLVTVGEKIIAIQRHVVDPSMFVDDPDKTVRMWAVKLSSAPHEWKDDPSPNVRLEALYSSMRRDEPHPEYFLTSMYPDVRTSALSIINDQGLETRVSDEQWLYLIRRDPSPMVRAEAAREGRFSDDFARDPDPRVRAITALSGNSLDILRTDSEPAVASIANEMSLNNHHDDNKDGRIGRLSDMLGLFSARSLLGIAASELKDRGWNEPWGYSLADNSPTKSIGGGSMNLRELR